MIPVLCPACLSVIGHGHLAEHDGSIGGWVEEHEHECNEEIQWPRN